MMKDSTVEANAGATVLTLEQLAPGDLLLSMGVGPLSEHIRRVCGGRYSHAALACGDGRLIESTTPHVRRVTLQESLGHPRQYVHAYRYRGSNTTPGLPPERGRTVVRNAEIYLDRRYSFVDLVYAYLRIVSKVPQDGSAPLLVRMIDAYLNAEKENQRVTCVELVVRAYHASQLDIQVDTAWRTTVTPGEVIQFWVEHGRQALGSLKSEAVDTAPPEPLADPWLPGPDELEAWLAPLQEDGRAEAAASTAVTDQVAALERQVLELRPTLAPMTDQAVASGLRPARDAMHLVTPYQLERSPSFEYIGTIAL